MKKTFKLFYLLFSLFFLFYLSLSSPPFPEPPPDALFSNEPGDTENLEVRRAYFTDYSRQEVLEYYEKQFEKLGGFNFGLLTYRLNYPPEEAMTIIRDQTRSTFLEEIVHPMRESFFVNGFEPTNPSDTIFIEDRVWRQKITVKYFPSSLSVRLAVGVITLLLFWIIIFEWEKAIGALRKAVQK